MSQVNGHKTGQEYETWGEPTNSHVNGGEDPQELNSTQSRQGKDGRGKGKGKDGKGKKENGKEIKAEERREDNHPMVDALSAVASIGHRSARKTL